MSRFLLIKWDRLTWMLKLVGRYSLCSRGANMNKKNAKAFTHSSELRFKLLMRFPHQFDRIFFWCGLIQNPDTINQPSIDLKTQKIWKLNKDFKKVGPIRNNPSYKSQCVVFWRNLTQNERSFLQKFHLKPASNF